MLACESSILLPTLPPSSSRTSSNTHLCLFTFSLSLSRPVRPNFEHPNVRKHTVHPYVASSRQRSSRQAARRQRSSRQAARRQRCSRQQHHFSASKANQSDSLFRHSFQTALCACPRPRHTNNDVSIYVQPSISDGLCVRMRRVGGTARPPTCGTPAAKKKRSPGTRTHPAVASGGDSFSGF